MDSFDEAKRKQAELKKEALSALTDEHREILQGALSVEGRSSSCTDEEREAKLKELIEQIIR